MTEKIENNELSFLIYFTNYFWWIGFEMTKNHIFQIGNYFDRGKMSNGDINIEGGESVSSGCGSVIASDQAKGENLSWFTD